MNWSLLLMAAWMITGCLDGPISVLQITPRNRDSGESRNYFVTEGETQAADPARLGDLAGNMTDISYTVSPRFQPFLLPGDLAAGTEPDGLLLPVLAEGITSRDLDLTAFTVSKWRSLRVYDRGECSLTAPWQGTVQQLANQLVDQFNAADGVRGVQLLSGQGESYATPVLRASFENGPSRAPENADELDLVLRIFGERFENGQERGCSNVRMTINIRIALVQTDTMQVPMSAEAFTLGCRCRADVDAASTMRGCVPPMDSPEWSQDAARREELVERLLFSPQCSSAVAPDFFERCISGRIEFLEASHTTGRATCTPDAVMGSLPLRRLQRIRSMAVLAGGDFTRGGLDGLDGDVREQLLVGIAAIDGHPLGAHDLVAQVLEVSISNFTYSHCFLGNVGKNAVKNNLRKKLRQSLPLALRDGVLAVGVQPGLAGGVIEFTRCDTDANCDWRNGDPAFVSDGVWRGARHVCRSHQCQIQIEPNWLNVRPDGLEAVLVDRLTTDPQASFFDPDVFGGNGTLLGTRTCTNRRNSGVLPDGEPEPQAGEPDPVLRMPEALATTVPIVLAPYAPAAP